MVQNGGTKMQLKPFNTDTPFLYLDPATGNLVPFCQYIVVSSFSIFLFDLLDSFKDDYQHVVQQRFCFMSVVFVISRLSCLTFLLICCFILTAPLGDQCERTVFVVATVFIFYRASTCALFYARVKAVYPQNRLVKAAFALLWCFAVGGAISSIFSVTAVRIGPTMYCIPATVGLWELVFMVAAEGIYDLLVCIAVTYKVREYRMAEDGELDGACGPWLWFSPSKRSRLADRFLRDSQLYFLITACVKIPEILVILCFSIIIPSASGISVVLVYPDTAVTNILATKIYRNMKLRRPGLLPLRRSGVGSTFANLGGRSNPFLFFTAILNKTSTTNEIPLSQIEH
ncbi:hypothetical protein CPB83DRAFT_100817 [Crepidotus variabilis]|uniref:Uncharacterized protein n=1 Tax=Crepidotus variabilis TaxID=179855 RepID=A0A9P6JT10_9AGAR|nr:hypothetical protein CPB83DRAFT_100817 [Crepidotus variabilis]